MATTLSSTDQHAPLLRLDSYTWSLITPYLPSNELFTLFLAGSVALKQKLALTSHFCGKSVFAKFPNLNKVVDTAHSLLKNVTSFTYAAAFKNQRIIVMDWRNRLPNLRKLNLAFDGCLDSLSSVGSINACWPLLEELILRESENHWAVYDDTLNSKLFNLSTLPEGLRILRLFCHRSTSIHPSHLLSLPSTLEELTLDTMIRFVADPPSQDVPDIEYAIRDLPTPSLKSLTLRCGRTCYWKVSLRHLPSSLTALHVLGSCSMPMQYSSVTSVKVDWEDVSPTLCKIATLSLAQATVPLPSLETLPASVTRLTSKLDVKREDPMSRYKPHFKSFVSFYSGGLTPMALTTYFLEHLPDISPHLQHLHIEAVPSYTGAKLPDSITHLQCNHISIALLPAKLEKLQCQRLTLPNPKVEGELRAFGHIDFNLPPTLKSIRISTNALSSHHVLIGGLPASLETLEALVDETGVEILFRQIRNGLLPLLSTIRLDWPISIPLLASVPSTVTDLTATCETSTPKLPLNSKREVSAPTFAALKSSSLIALQLSHAQLRTALAEPYTNDLIENLPPTLKQLRLFALPYNFPEHVKWPHKLVLLSVAYQSHADRVAKAFVPRPRSSSPQSSDTSDAASHADEPHTSGVDALPVTLGELTLTGNFPTDEYPPFLSGIPSQCATEYRSTRFNSILAIPSYAKDATWKSIKLDPSSQPIEFVLP